MIIKKISPKIWVLRKTLPNCAKIGWFLRKTPVFRHKLAKIAKIM
jgi:hypothetical protein